MREIVIYHNPRCSKSREVLQFLQNKQLLLKIIEYLKTFFILGDQHTCEYSGFDQYQEGLNLE